MEWEIKSNSILAENMTSLWFHHRNKIYSIMKNNFDFNRKTRLIKPSQIFILPLAKMFSTTICRILSGFHYSAQNKYNQHVYVYVTTMKLTTKLAIECLSYCRNISNCQRILFHAQSFLASCEVFVTSLPILLTANVF